MKKKHKDNRWLCYIGLVVLFVLLLAPPLLRLFGKNLYVKEEIAKDEVILLICGKQNESVRSAFLNGEFQNIEYNITGDYSVNKIDEYVSEDDTIGNSDVLKQIKPYAQAEYDRVENITNFKVTMNNLRENGNYTALFSTLENQQVYFDSQAFYCSKTTY